MLSLKSALCAGLLLAAPYAVHAGPLAYDNPLGITVAMEEEGSPSADPAGRLDLILQDISSIPNGPMENAVGPHRKKCRRGPFHT